MDAALFPVVTDADMRLPVYMTTIGHWDHQEPVRRSEGFPDFQWHHVLSGEGVLEVEGKRLTVKAGQSFCLFPRVPHEYESVKAPWELIWVSFDGAWTAELLSQAGVGKSGVYRPDRPERIASHLGGLLSYAQQPPASHPFLGMEYSKRLYSFLLELRDYVQEGAPSSESNRSRLHPVLQLIDKQLHRPILIAEMANAAGISPQHLCTLFRRTMDIRPMEYVNRERIKRSKELMFREGGTPIREIALRVGFDNPSYFSAVFKRLEGQSPEQFKRMHGLKV